MSIQLDFSIFAVDKKSKTFYLVSILFILFQEHFYLIVDLTINSFCTNCLFIILKIKCCVLKKFLCFNFADNKLDRKDEVNVVNEVTTCTV